MISLMIAGYAWYLFGFAWALAFMVVFNLAFIAFLEWSCLDDESTMIPRWKAYLYGSYGLLEQDARNIVRMILLVAGFVVVPIALMDRRSMGIKDNGDPLVRLPRWARWWDNLDNGALGDDNWKDKHGQKVLSVWYMFQWLQLRNPVNGLRWVKFFGILPDDIENLEWYGDQYISDKYGVKGFQIVYASISGRKAPVVGVYGFVPYGNADGFWKDRGMRARYGYKIHPSSDRMSLKPIGTTGATNPIQTVDHP